MKKEKKEKISFIGFLTASIIYFIGSILNFIDKNIGTGTMFLCLGFSFLCLATTHLDKKEDKNNWTGGDRCKLFISLRKW